MVHFLTTLIFLSILGSHFLSINALIPRACAKNFTTEPSVCCPTPPGYTSPCGYPTRGICMPLQVHRPVQRVRDLHFMKTDIRFLWPTRIFSMTCTCNGLYWGPDCGECRFGFGGKNCTKRIIRVRRNIMSLSAKERKQLLQIFAKVRTLKSEYLAPKLHTHQYRWSRDFIEVDPYEYINFNHVIATIPEPTHNATRCILTDMKGWDYGHNEVMFPMYHRYLMMLFERTLARVALEHFGIDNFALPYWDWTNLHSCDVCTNDLVGESSKDFDTEMNAHYISKKSVFGDPKKWPIYCESSHRFLDLCEPCHFNRSNPLRASRRFTSLDMPTVDEILELLSIPQYDNLMNWCSSFERIFELGYYCVCAWKRSPFIAHIKLHRFMRGTFGPLDTATFDPIFLLHHIQIDRLFERWRRGVMPGSKELRDLAVHGSHCASCNIAPFIPTVRGKEMYMDTRHWGYTFDNMDFGPLSEKVKIASWNGVFRKKTCPGPTVLG